MVNSKNCSGKLGIEPDRSGSLAWRKIVWFQRDLRMAQDGSAGCNQSSEGFFVEDPTAAFPLHACAHTCETLGLRDQLILNGCGGL